MINRRRFLRGAAALGAAAGIRSRQVFANPTEALAGKIFFKGEHRYEPLRQAASFNARKPNRYPNAIVLAESEADVIAAVKLAEERGWQVTARSGGHSWSGSHTRDNSVQINLARMQEVVVDADAGIARLNPAVSGDALNTRLRQDYRLFTPSAHGVNVGMGGFVMCGGHGWNSRVFGLGCANLTAVDVITAAGELIHASETQNSDYLWAARGSGPGFFGVATRYYQRLHRLPPVTKSSGALWDFEHFESVFGWVRNTLASFPKNLEVVLIVTSREGKLVVTVVGTCMGETDAAVERELAVMGTCPVMNRALAKWENRDRIVPASVEDPEEIQPTGARFSVDNVWTQASAAQLAAPLRSICTAFPTPQCSLFVQCWGPIQKLPDMAYSVQADLYIAFNGTNYDPSDDERVAAWAVDSARQVDKLAIGAQMNDENMERRAARYLSPRAAERLEALRHKHDPHGRFPGFLRA